MSRCRELFVIDLFSRPKKKTGRRVKLQAHPRNYAGGIFGVRVDMPAKFNITNYPLAVGDLR